MDLDFTLLCESYQLNYIYKDSPSQLKENRTSKSFQIYNFCSLVMTLPKRVRCGSSSNNSSSGF